MICFNPPDGTETILVTTGTSRGCLENYKYSCNTGYITEDSLSITCMIDGTWYGSPPVCTR